MPYFPLFELLSFWSKIGNGKCKNLAPITWPSTLNPGGREGRKEKRSEEKREGQEIKLKFLPNQRNI